MTWCAFCVFHAYLRFGLFVYKQKAKQMLRFCKQIWLFNKTNSTYECSNNENTRNYVKDNEKEMQKKGSKTYESRTKTCSNSQHRKLFKWLKTKVHISQWRNNNHHTLVACPSRIRIGSEQRRNGKATTIFYLLRFAWPKTKTFKWRLLKCKDLFCMNNIDAQCDKLIITKNGSYYITRRKTWEIEKKKRKKIQLDLQKKTSHLFLNSF